MLFAVNRYGVLAMAMASVVNVVDVGPGFGVSVFTLSGIVGDSLGLCSGCTGRRSFASWSLIEICPQMLCCRSRNRYFRYRRRYRLRQ